MSTHASPAGSSPTLKPNSEHEVVPADWARALEGCVTMLSNFRLVTEFQLKELNKPFGR